MEGLGRTIFGVLFISGLLSIPCIFYWWQRKWKNRKEVRVKTETEVFNTAVNVEVNKRTAELEQLIATKLKPVIDLTNDNFANLQRQISDLRKVVEDAHQKPQEPAPSPDQTQTKPTQDEDGLKERIAELERQMDSLHQLVEDAHQKPQESAPEPQSVEVKPTQSEDRLKERVAELEQHARRVNDDLKKIRENAANGATLFETAKTDFEKRLAGQETQNNQRAEAFQKNLVRVIAKVEATKEALQAAEKGFRDGLDSQKTKQSAQNEALMQKFGKMQSDLKDILQLLPSS